MKNIIKQPELNINIKKCGNKEQSVNVIDEDSFEYGEISESVEEIAKSFSSSQMSFITSTPERRIVKEEEVEIVENEVEKRWSQVTHISESGPLQTCPQDYDFALNSVLSITQKNLIPQENRIDASDRFDKLLSIIQEENLMDESLLPLNADKSIAQSRRAAIMGQIEGIIQVLLMSLTKNKKMVLKIQKVKDFKDCEMNNAVLSQKETAIAVKHLSFTNKITQRTFTILLTLLCEIYKMLTKNISCTKRELYYRDTDLMVNQVTVNRAIDDICILLNVSQWELGVLSSSKGLIAGDLKIKIGKLNKTY